MKGFAYNSAFRISCETCTLPNHFSSRETWELKPGESLSITGDDADTMLAALAGQRPNVVGGLIVGTKKAEKQWYLKNAVYSTPRDENQWWSDCTLGEIMRLHTNVGRSSPDFGLNWGCTRNKRYVECTLAEKTKLRLCLAVGRLAADKVLFAEDPFANLNLEEASIAMELLMSELSGAMMVLAFPTPNTTLPFHLFTRSVSLPCKRPLVNQPMRALTTDALFPCQVALLRGYRSPWSTLVSLAVHGALLTVFAFYGVGVEVATAASLDAALFVRRSAYAETARVCAKRPFWALQACLWDALNVGCLMSLTNVLVYGTSFWLVSVYGLTLLFTHAAFSPWCVPSLFTPLALVLSQNRRALFFLDERASGPACAALALSILFFLLLNAKMAGAKGRNPGERPRQNVM